MEMKNRERAEIMSLTDRLATTEAKVQSLAKELVKANQLLWYFDADGIEDAMKALEREHGSLGGTAAHDGMNCGCGMSRTWLALKHVREHLEQMDKAGTPVSSRTRDL